MKAERMDLREGYRIEVEPMVMPAGEYGARLYRPPANGRGRWRQVGALVVAPSPEQAASDLLTAVNEGLFPGVEVAG